MIRLPVAWLKVQPAKATVVGVHGDASAVDARGTRAKITQGMPFGIGTTLLTSANASLTLQFADGSRLLLHGDSELTLDKLSAYGATGMTDTRMRLPKGRTSNEVKPLRGAGSHFIIETPDLMSSVRGTRFRVGSDGADSRIEVTEGRVQVDGAGRTRLLRSNQGTINTIGDGPAAQTTLLAEPALVELDSTQRPMLLRWAPVPGAHRYRVQVGATTAFPYRDADRVLPMPALVEAAAGLGEPHWQALALATLAANGGMPAKVIPGERAGTSDPSPYLWRQDHRVLLPYVRADSFQQVSYVDVVRGQIPAALLRDRWLLVGVTAHGLGDSILTPLPGGEERMPGVIYQATLLNMLLQDSAIVPLPVAWQLVIAVLLALIPVVLLLRQPWQPAWSLGLASAAIILATTAALLLLARLWLPPMPALSALLLASLLLAAYRMRLSHRLAHSDALTRLANRRLFDLILRRECLAASRSGKPVSLLLIDIDNFKRYNDGCGHQAGDELLRAVAGAVARHVSRPRDLSARYGGDELAAILPETEAHVANTIAEAIVRDVASLAIPHPGNDANAMATISVGVAACDPQHEDEASLLERTDIALYQAKNHGRNRSYTAPDWTA